MFVTYSVVVLLAVILIAIVVVWARSRNTPEGSSQPEANVAEAALAKRVDPRADSLQTASRPDDFDEDATQIYRLPSQAPTPTAAPTRAGASPAALTGAHLVGLTGSHKGRRFPVVGAGITVGRNSSCDIVLADPRVSAHHAWVGIVDGKVTVRDLKSTNGTFLNAQTHSSVSEAELRSGDTIFFGDHQRDQFRFVAD